MYVHIHMYIQKSIVFASFWVLLLCLNILGESVKGVTFLNKKTRLD